MKDINADGKFLDRFVPALIAVTMGVGGTALVFWSDTRANDKLTADAIATLKDDIKDIRTLASNDRQKQSEITVDVKVLLSIVRRIEARMEREDNSRLPIPIPR